MGWQAASPRAVLAGSSQTIRVLAADGDQTAVDKLGLALLCIPDAELVATASSIAELKRSVRAHLPDVVIFDAEMMDRGGADVVAGLRALERPPELIFTANHEKHAIRAFELNAVDFLVKPVSFDRLRESCRRAGERLRARQADARFAELQRLVLTLSSATGAGPAAGHARSIWVKKDGDLTQIPVEDIHWLQAAGDYVIAHADDAEHFLGDSLTTLQDRLDPATFLRVHRSAIVNLAHVRSLRKRRPRGIALVLSSGKQVLVGPSFEAAVLEAMNVRRWR